MGAKGYSSGYRIVGGRRAMRRNDCQERERERERERGIRPLSSVCALGRDAVVTRGLVRGSCARVGVVMPSVMWL